MPAWKYAFSLSLEEVKNATPPGTVQLIGMYLRKHLNIPDLHDGDPA